MAKDVEYLNGIQVRHGSTQSSPAVNRDAATNTCVDITAFRQQMQALVSLEQVLAPSRKQRVEPKQEGVQCVPTLQGAWLEGRLTWWHCSHLWLGKGCSWGVGSCPGVTVLVLLVASKSSSL